MTSTEGASGHEAYVQWVPHTKTWKHNALSTKVTATGECWGTSIKCQVEHSHIQDNRIWHTSLLVQHDLACLPLQKHSKQIPLDTNCLQAPTSMTSYPVQHQNTVRHQRGEKHSFLGKPVNQQENICWKLKITTHMFQPFALITHP